MKKSIHQLIKSFMYEIQQMRAKPAQTVMINTKLFIQHIEKKQYQSFHD